MKNIDKDHVDKAHDNMTQPIRLLKYRISDNPRNHATIKAKRSLLRDEGRKDHYYEILLTRNRIWQMETAKMELEQLG